MHKWPPCKSARLCQCRDLSCRNAFHPVPGVDSAVAEFILHDQLDERLSGHEAAFVAFINGAFSMKRKTLANNLKRRLPQPDIEKCFEISALSPLVRAESLDLDTFVALFGCFKTHSGELALPRGS